MLIIALIILFRIGVSSIRPLGMVLRARFLRDWLSPRTSSANFFKLTNSSASDLANLTKVALHMEAMAVGTTGQKSTKECISSLLIHCGGSFNILWTHLCSIAAKDEGSIGSIN